MSEQPNTAVASACDATVLVTYPDTPPDQTEQEAEEDGLEQQ